jgi:methylenetetrahydrofolate--tRNA-(uracil-5-)-methyltransferase
VTAGRFISVIGGGLAGTEAAWQLLRRGHAVDLFEMRPGTSSPAHKTALLAELVCSNSLRASSRENAVGLLKEEMRLLGSIMMDSAAKAAVPAGRALAVDRRIFSLFTEDQLLSRERFRLVRRECTEIPDTTPAIIATGPLTSDSLASGIASLTGNRDLYFYDAISPIIEADSIDFDQVFSASRYDDEDGGDYLNCPLEKEEYDLFWNALVAAEEVPLRDFEEAKFFEGCLPVEVIAKRGIETLVFGPMKPVGLRDPRTGKQPYAVVQLRRENREATLYNMVGFQTKLTWPEQRRIFRMIPGLKEAEFVRLGSIHRNTYINSPVLLDQSLQLRAKPGIFFAGQITGVEGYVESAAMGLLAGLSAACLAEGRPFIPPPPTTALGALLRYITSAESRTFQPMNVNFGIFPPITERIRHRERGAYRAVRSLADLGQWKEDCGY